VTILVTNNYLFCKLLSKSWSLKLVVNKTFYCNGRYQSWSSQF